MTKFIVQSIGRYFRQLSNQKILPFVGMVLLISFVFAVSGCASQIIVDSYEPPGFFMGIIHGLIVPFSFVGSWFSSDIRIYAFPNTGVGYDFGFLIGLVSSSLVSIGAIADS
ncbi:MAG: hypothetical protein WCI01_01525 [Chlorobiaceae bacterium]